MNSVIGLSHDGGFRKTGVTRGFTDSSLLHCGPECIQGLTCTILPVHYQLDIETNSTILGTHHGTKLVKNPSYRMRTQSTQLRNTVQLRWPDNNTKRFTLWGYPAFNYRIDYVISTYYAVKM